MNVNYPVSHDDSVTEAICCVSTAVTDPCESKSNNSESANQSTAARETSVTCDGGNTLIQFVVKKHVVRIRQEGLHLEIHEHVQEPVLSNGDIETFAIVDVPMSKPSTWHVAAYRQKAYSCKDPPLYVLHLSLAETAKQWSLEKGSYTFDPLQGILWSDTLSGPEPRPQCVLQPVAMRNGVIRFVDVADEACRELGGGRLWTVGARLVTKRDNRKATIVGRRWGDLFVVLDNYPGASYWKGKNPRDVLELDDDHPTENTKTTTEQPSSTVSHSHADRVEETTKQQQQSQRDAPSPPEMFQCTTLSQGSVLVCGSPSLPSRVDAGSDSSPCVPSDSTVLSTFPAQQTTVSPSPMPLSSTSSSDGGGSVFCIVCESSTVSAVLLPCFHAQFCLSCAETLFAKKRTRQMSPNDGSLSPSQHQHIAPSTAPAVCPVCSVQIEKVQRIFLP